MNSQILLAFALLLVSAVGVYLACEYFVNGVEWVGRKAGIAQSAVGTVLAAFGTALPESVVTFVAVVFGRTADQREIGVGAALGGPLALATIAYPVVGLMLLLTHQGTARAAIAAERSTLTRDQGLFLAIFVCKIALGFMVFSWKPWLAIFFLAAYAFYVWSSMRAGVTHSEEDSEPLKLQPGKESPSLALASLQTLIALVVIFIGSRVFVTQLTVVGPWLGLPPSVVALLLSPVATELPETMNAIIWIRQGKLRLALGNISGAMMIQATVPTALGLMFTPWLFDHALAWSAAVTAAAVLGLWLLLWRNALTSSRLASFFGFYVLFAAGVYYITSR